MAMTSRSKQVALVSLVAGAFLVPAHSNRAEEHSQPNRITILYDAFGKNPAMKKDWGFSAFVEINGKRILFDTGNDGTTFAANVKAKGVDLSRLDFVVLSHRHSDHMAGLAHVLSMNPHVKIYAPKEGFGIYGSSLPSSFYRKDDSLPADMRYYDGKPPQVMQFGAAWPDANIETIDKSTEIAPGMNLLALISDAPGTKELKELSLTLNTPQGMIIIVGCSHPGIDKIVEAATAINPKIHLVLGGFHMVTATDEGIAKTVSSLKDVYKVSNIAPGHCTGEPTFAALQRAFGSNYLYAGLGTSLQIDSLAVNTRRGEGPGLDGTDASTYRRLARREDPLGTFAWRLRTAARRDLPLIPNSSP